MNTKFLKYFSLNKGGKNILVLFFAVKIILIAFILTFYNVLPFSSRDYEVNSDHFHGQEQSNIEQGFSPYDAPQYLDIAYFGYKKIGEIDSKKFAFFPLYPFLIRLGAPFFGNDFTIAGIIISLVASLFGTIFFYKLVLLDESEDTAFFSIKYFLIYPTAFFFCAVYTESLFFFLSILTFYLLRKKKWWMAGIAGLLGALTRPPGILLFLPFIIEFAVSLRGKKWKEYWLQPLKKKISFLAAFLIPLGTLSYFIYLYFSIGNFFAYFDALSYWSRSKIGLGKLFTVLYDKISNFNSLPLHSFYSSKLDLIFVLAFLVLLIFFYKKIRFSYFIYGLSVAILPLMSGQTMSLMRYLSVSFPVFLILGIAGAKNRTFDTALSLVWIMMLAILSLKLFNWYWVG